VLAIDPQASNRCARAHPVATALIATLRDELAALTSEQMAEVTKRTAELAQLGLTASGMHIGTCWLQGLAPTLPATRPMGVVLAPQPPLGTWRRRRARARWRLRGSSRASGSFRSNPIRTITGPTIRRQ
jgi:hypothetical protein